MNTTTTLTIRVQDVDDQDPVFDTAEVLAENCSLPASVTCKPTYHSSFVEGEVAGVLDVTPGRIHAKDLDTLGAPIIYSFKSGSPASYEDYFKIDPRSAAVTQTKAVDRAQIKNFDIVIEVSSFLFQDLDLNNFYFKTFTKIISPLLIHISPLKIICNGAQNAVEKHLQFCTKNLFFYK